MQKEIAKRTGYEVTRGGTTQVYYVKNVKSPEGKEYEVDFTKKLDSVSCCHYVCINQLPCRHCIPVFYKRQMFSNRRKTEATIAAFWPKWARADVYRDMYTGKSVLRPEIYVGPFTGPDEDRREVPIQDHKPKGRPKKKRYTGRKKTVKSVKETLPIVYHAKYEEIMEFL